MRQLTTIFFSIILILVLLANIHGSKSSCIDITINRDGTLLKGKFYSVNRTGSFPTVVLLHGFPGNDKDVLGLGKKMSESGINTLTFNYSGTPQSQGTFNFENTQKDISAVFEFINQPENINKFKLDNTRIYLVGYSYGGGMALTYATSHPEIKRGISIAGNDHGAFMEEYKRNPKMRQMIDEMFAKLSPPAGNIRFAKGGTPREIAEMKIIENNPTYDLRKCAKSLAGKDILLIGGWDDLNVSFESIILPLYRELKKEGAKNVKIAAFQDTHSFRKTRDKLARTIIKWIKTSSEKIQ
jgi:dipeptidyl aminopeptidase/acylaminoacyl peptidase